ncbi:MAG: hypothetical protein H6713_00935 [Myxococcales bacterium]|nr:hypothetical protein [Myxococcales bacterium]
MCQVAPTRRALWHDFAVLRAASLLGLTLVSGAPPPGAWTTTRPAPRERASSWC